MITKDENELLCRVENGAPMGKLMRQHWVPICLSEEVAEADGDPVTAKILGENLVVFRDSDGQVGVLDEACPHRGPSLSYGRNEEGGLRCLCVPESFKKCMGIDRTYRNVFFTMI